MRVGVVGAGYVGVVVAACLAEVGHEVGLCDRVAERVQHLQRGAAPLREPRLDDLVARAVASGRLRATEDLADVVSGAAVVIIAVGTPSGPGGDSDLTALLKAVEQVAAVIGRDGLVVVKSTVPVGTAERLRAILRGRGRSDVRVVSNPEFLAEGTAVDDFLRPARIVLGTDDPSVLPTMRRLYKAMLHPPCSLLTMSNESAELAKYASNAMLATRVTLMNELAGLSSSVGADIEEVRKVVGSDPRIGSLYLRAGAGFGGSCFPKDLLALEQMGRDASVPMPIVTSVREVNTRQKRRVADMARELLGGLAGRVVAVWGLAFKPDTDDLRQAPALVLIDTLLAEGARVVAYDPAAVEGARHRYGDAVHFASSALAAVQDADALCVVTGWAEFRAIDLSVVARRMRGRIVVDGRNLYDPSEVAAAGFTYASIGRPVARPDVPEPP